MNYSYKKHSNFQCGFCLLEVLIASCVLSGLLVSVFVIQCSSIRHIQQYYIQQAIVRAVNNFAETIYGCSNDSCKYHVYSKWQKLPIVSFNNNIFNVDRSFTCSDYRCKLDVMWGDSEKSTFWF